MIETRACYDWSVCSDISDLTPILPSAILYFRSAMDRRLICAARTQWLEHDNLMIVRIYGIITQNINEYATLPGTCMNQA